MADFKDLLLKIATNARLTPQELDDLARYGTETQNKNSVVDGWTKGTGPSANMTFNKINFLSSPLKQYSFEMQTDKSVANNSAEYLTFDAFKGDGDGFQVDSADKSKIRVVNVGDSFHVSGLLNWNNNATGYRYVALEGFTQADVSLGFVGLHLFPGTATEDNSFPVSYTVNYRTFTNFSYMKFFVRQTSGGSLTLFYALLSAFIV